MSTVALKEEIYLHSLLEVVEQRLHEVASCSNTMGELASQVIKAGGKRLRPLLVILSSWRDDNDWEPVIDVAVAAELLHTASLVHDDIIDRADTRRGVPTINVTQGNHTAVMTGDYLFARALSLLSKQRTCSALSFMVDAIQAMCEGIMEEMASLFDPTVTEKDYFSRIDKKTASLVAACCGAGAAVSGASPEEVEDRAAFGRNLGLSFQIIDDILDFTSDEETLGKPAGSDLNQGILTLPVIYLLQHADYDSCIKDILTNRSCTSTDLSYIQHAAQKTACISKAFNKAREFQEKAKSHLSFLPATPVHTILHKITDMVTARKN